MVTWRVARSLDTLLSQLNKAAPRRSKASDGSIGDAAHATRDSDHNPWIKAGGLGVVTARDFTHDPAGGLDCNWLAKALVASGDPRIKYVIWNRRIWTPKSGWVAYYGANPHDHHLHLSVSVQPGWFDSTLPWSLPGAVISPIKNLPVQEDDMPYSEDDLRRIVREAVWLDSLNGVNARDRLIGVDTKTEDVGGQVWRYPTSGQGVQAQDRLTGVDTLVQAVAAGRLTAADVAAALAPTIREAVASADLDGASADEVADKVADKLAARLAG